jgi:hypothetical protein
MKQTNALTDDQIGIHHALVSIGTSKEASKELGMFVPYAHYSRITYPE